MGWSEFGLVWFPLHRAPPPLLLPSPMSMRALGAVVFGIVTNTFSTLREAREAITSDITSRCCICGVNRNDLEKDTQSFQAHVGGVHNVRCQCLCQCRCKC